MRSVGLDEPIFVRTPGFVQAVEHDAGDRVKAGDVIVRLADPTLQNELDQAVSRREQEGRSDRDSKREQNESKRDRNRNVVPLDDQHLDADESQDC